MSSVPSRKTVVNAIDPGGPHGCDSKPFQINYSLTRTPFIILACFSRYESSTQRSFLSAGKRQTTNNETCSNITRRRFLKIYEVNDSQTTYIGSVPLSRHKRFNVSHGNNPRRDLMVRETNVEMIPTEFIVSRSDIPHEVAPSKAVI